ncbi:MAG: response regulator [Candidatus Riflebacteria bacterium]|nr:response regulator [Candidatus Riflebacteria bacterium]
MPAPDVIRVLIVDDKIELRQNIKRLISFEESMEVAGEASNGQVAIEMARSSRPDVVIMDTHMPVMDGIAATEVLSQEMPECSVIMMSVEGEHDLIRRAMKAGARDFLVKPFSTEELLETIKNVYKTDQKRRQLYQVSPSTKDGAGEGSRRKDHGEVVTFFSTKGGIGKTVILCNLAIALAKRAGARVAVVDCDLQFGDTAIMMNLYPSRTIANLVEEPPPWSSQLIQEYMIRHEESGVDVLLSPSRPEYAEIVQVEHVEQCLMLLKEKYDYILVDTIPLFRNIELSILDASDKIFVLVNLEISAIKDVKLCLDLMANLNYSGDKVKLVLNKGYPPIGGVSADDVQGGLKREIAAVIPNAEKEIVESINKGKPFMLRPEVHGTELGKAILKLASVLAGDRVGQAQEESQGSKSLFQRFFSSK